MMNNFTNWTLTAICAALLTGCGSSQDKAEELVEMMNVDANYGLIVQAAAAGYAPKFRDVKPDQIKTVVKDKIPLKFLKQTMVDVYADTFDSDELDLMIKANKNPANAMSIIMGSKDGQKLAMKAVRVQNDLQMDMAKAMQDKDEDILDELNDLQDEARS
ncbi:hypothetical protein [Pseudomonas violetae]|nr:hypothetical protein [Pseudomonas violetae]